MNKNFKDDDNDEDDKTLNLLESKYLDINSNKLSLLENILPAEEINMNYETSIWTISDYTINKDENPEIIIKKLQHDTNLEYIQELFIKYLKPPTPPPPGEIIISQKPNNLTPPAPPLVIRQQPCRPVTPEPLIFREEPPNPPDRLGIKLIKIRGKKYPPPPRKVVIERLAQLPPKPQSIILEKWLPYSFLKNEERKLLFPNLK